MHKLSINHIFISFFYCCCSIANSQNIVEHKSSYYSITYASKPWNKQSTAIDTAFMFLKNPATQQLVKINLEETAPDSSIFSGQFSLSWNVKSNSDVFAYVPPQGFRNNNVAVERFNALLKNGKIQPQPISFRNSEKIMSLEIYDTHEQAQRAQQEYNKELEAKEQAEKVKLVKPQVDESSLQVAKQAQRAIVLAKLAQDIANREKERIQLEKIEEQKIRALREKQNRLTQSEKIKRQNLAKQYSQKAIQYYQNNEFSSAADYFQKSIELDPENQEHHFMYGVSLYRLDRLNDALVAFKISKTNLQTNIEKKYYMGLIHFKLNEYSQATAHFKETVDSNDKVLAPSAAFYAGLAYLAQDELDLSQKSFEYVIDNSSNPTMDKKAEDYLEQIAKRIAFKKLAEKKWLANIQIGLNYDSNILFTPENDLSTATNQFDDGGLRLNLTGDLEHRFFYKEKSELSGKISITNTQSASDDFVQADPLTYSATLPYVRKGLYSKKGYKLVLAPSYESTYLDINRAEQLTHILHSIIFNTDLLFIMKNNWFTSVNLDLRQDDSLIDEDAGTDDDADAKKISVRKTEILFVDEEKKRSLSPYLAIVLNNAKGIDRYYSRIEFGASYSSPFKNLKNTTWTAGLVSYIQTFSKSTDNRRDTNVTLTYSTNKIINEKWNWGTTSSYTSNSSNVSASDFSKYSITVLAAYSWGK